MQPLLHGELGHPRIKVLAGDLRVHNASIDLLHLFTRNGIQPKYVERMQFILIDLSYPKMRIGAGGLLLYKSWDSQEGLVVRKGYIIGVYSIKLYIIYYIVYRSIYLYRDREVS